MAWNNGSGSWRYCEGYVYNPFGETLNPPQPQIQPLQQPPEDQIKLMYEDLLRRFDSLERRLSRKDEPQTLNELRRSREKFESIVTPKEEVHPKEERIEDEKLTKEEDGSDSPIPISTEIIPISAKIPVQKENLGLIHTNLGQDFLHGCPRFSEIRPCGFHLTRAAPKSWRAVPKEPPKVRLKLLPHQGKLSNKYGVTHKTTLYHPPMLGRVKIFHQDMKRVLKKKFYESCEKWLQGLDEQSKVFVVS